MKGNEVDSRGRQSEGRDKYDLSLWTSIIMMLSYYSRFIPLSTSYSFYSLSSWFCVRTFFQKINLEMYYASHFHNRPMNCSNSNPNSARLCYTGVLRFLVHILRSHARDSKRCRYSVAMDTKPEG